MPSIATQAQIERLARALYMGCNPNGNPDVLKAAPQGQMGMVPKWRSYEPLAVQIVGALSWMDALDDFNEDSSILIAAMFGQDAADAVSFLAAPLAIAAE